MSKKSVYCIAATRDQADRIVDHLSLANFARNDISVLVLDKAAPRDFEDQDHIQDHQHTTSDHVGGALGFLTGIGVLAIPSVGLFIASGPVLAALSGGVHGVTVSSIVSGLIALGIPAVEAKRYEGKVRNGSVLIAVHADSTEEIILAEDIFTKAHAVDICAIDEESTLADMWSLIYAPIPGQRDYRTTITRS